MNKHSNLFGALIIITFLCCWSSYSTFAAESTAKAPLKQTLNAEEIIKTQAGKLFIKKKYAKALEEFKTLAQQYPASTAIKRYVGICLFRLNRDEEAIAVFDEAIRINQKDLASHKYLGAIYLRRGDLDKAGQEFTFLKTQDKKGKFGSFGGEQLAAIGRMKTEQGKYKASGRIPPAEFLKTTAAQHFMKAKYADALGELKTLENQYPRDPLIKRYQGMALHKMKDYDQAIQAFESGLTLAQEDPALHYYLAQSYFQKKDYEKAVKELKLAAQTDTSGVYKKKAETDQSAIGKIKEVAKKAEKKWSGSLSAGFDDNSNASSEPTKRQVPAQEHAFKFPVTVSLNYELPKLGPWNLKASYTNSDSFYSDTLDYLNTVSHMPGLNLSRTGELAGKPLITQISSGYTYTAINGKHYSKGYPQGVTFIYSPFDWYRITLADKYNYQVYKSRGTKAEVTSKYGPQNIVSVTNNFYMNKEKSLYAQAGYDFELNETEGSNFVKDANSVRAALNFPFFRSMDGNVSFKYKNSDYPETTAAIQREDNEYTADASLTAPFFIKPWKIKVAYVYKLNDSNDPAFNYVNHSGGASLQYYF